jgi:hypothetical protein
MKNLIFIFAVFCVLIFSGVASAQSLPRSLIVKSLAEQHGERPVAWGVITRGNMVIEVFRTDDGSTWSIVVTDKKNESVLLFSGADWTDTPFEKFPCPPDNLCLDH